MNHLAKQFADNISSKEALLENVDNENMRFSLLHDIINYYIFTDSKKAKYYLDEQQIIAEKHYDDHNYVIHYFINRALFQNQLYNYEQAESDLLHVIDFLDSIENPITEIDVYLDMAAVCQNQKKLKDVNKYLQLALRQLEKNPNRQRRLFAETISAALYCDLNNFVKSYETLRTLEQDFNAMLAELPIKGIYYQTMVLTTMARIIRTQNLDTAAEKYTQIIEICEAFGLKSRLTYHYLHLGNTYLNIGDYVKAEMCYQNTIEVVDDVSQESRVNAYSNLGKCRLENNDFVKAIAHLTFAKRYWKSSQTSDYYNLSVNERYFSDLYFAMGKPDKAEKCLIKAMKYAEKSNNPNQIFQISLELSEYYAEMKNYKEAYIYRIKYEEALSEYLEATKLQDIERMELSHELDKQKKEAELERMNGVWLQNKALRAQMNPHFMSNLLNAIQSYVNAGDTRKASDSLSKFSVLMRNSLNYSDQETITLEEEVEFLTNYLELNQQLRYENRLDFRITFEDDLEDDLDFLEVPSMIIQPYVENAIEHGLKSISQGFLTIMFRQYDDDNILCVIEDNGIGRALAAQRANNPMKNHRSMGTYITESRLKLLHESIPHQIPEFIKIIDLYDGNNKAAGTRVEVIIPIIGVKSEKGM
jgi:two-component system, LytTR family, sensor kinase